MAGSKKIRWSANDHDVPGYASVNIPLPNIDEFKCFFCKKYLNVSPIVSDIEQRHYCGRCPQFAGLQRNLLFERIARHFQFPCSVSDKCHEMVRWDSRQHEDECEYNIVKCPYALCNAEVERWSITKHFEQMHGYLKSNGNTFSLKICPNKDGSFNESEFFQCGFKKYLIQTISTQDGLHLNVFNLCFSEIEEQKFSFSIQVKERIIRFSCLWDVPKFPINLKHSNYGPVKLKYTFLKLFDSGKSPEINIEIKLHTSIENQIFGGSTDSSCFSLIKRNSECPICFYTMQQQYLCVLGHGVCKDCKLVTTLCPICRKGLTDNYNHAMHQLVKCYDIEDD
ncbi:uncharacterized protein LOC143192486 [Rhynchophorus ferrugineus]|uniref:uncharacterized protein LOC143192486 n=1 Tax=Rhynchophorus ferrugineus TaxID=354439 RepID=UPI003FCECA20